MERTAPYTEYRTEKPAPNKPGWYYACPEDGKNIIPVKVNLNNTNNTLYVQTLDKNFHLSGWHWFGEVIMCREA